MVHGQQQLDMYNKPFKDEGLMKENYNHAKLRRNPLYPRGYRNGYHESWIEEIINDYLNDSMEARNLGLLDTFLNDKTARGFGAGVVNITGDTGAGIRKIGEEIIDENPIKQAYRRTFTENPIIEKKAKQSRGRPKGISFIQWKLESLYFKKRWKKSIKSDPYYNPNLSLKNEKGDLSSMIIYNISLR